MKNLHQIQPNMTARTKAILEWLLHYGYQVKYDGAYYFKAPNGHSWEKINFNSSAWRYHADEWRKLKAESKLHSIIREV